MNGERILVASRDPASISRDATDAAAGFGARIQAVLPQSYRLAAVILGDLTDAEDATHDAVERAWRSRRQLKDHERFEAWFQRIVVNSCVDHVRKRRSRPLLMAFHGGGAEEQPHHTHDGDPQTESAQRDALREALGRINVEQRVVIAMRFFLDLEVDEIARRLGTPSGTVKSRLHRGLKELRQVWETTR